MLLDAFDLTRAQVGLFVPAIYLGGVLMSMPAGWITDRLGVRATLAAGLAFLGDWRLALFVGFLIALSSTAIVLKVMTDKGEIDALARNIKTNFQQVVSLSPLLSDDLQTLAMNIAEPGRLADFIASSLTTITTPVKQEVLETLDVDGMSRDAANHSVYRRLEILEAATF